jgi:predicted phosphodiesterase
MKAKDAPQTLHIGQLTGRLLVFGGVYGNLPALLALQRAADTWGIPATNIICTGDVVAYCAEPEACVQAVRAWGVHCIAGNVELQLANGEADCGCDFSAGSRCDVFSRHWYPFVQAQLSTASVDWMRALPQHIRFCYGAHTVQVVHGSYHGVSDYVFASTPWALKAGQLADAQADVILAGHCGLPFGNARDGLHWLNAGVIGMPANDGTPRVWYMVLDTQPNGRLTYQHHALDYDYTQAAHLMREHHLPEAYALTLSSGIWDNCDILPAAETAQQGQPLLI